MAHTVDFSTMAWGFALRTWASTVLALYVAFWMQLQGGSSAAVTVAILSTPTRGPALAKAGYRLIGTAVGLAASIALAGLFNETRTLFLGALAGWLAVCVFAAGLLDSNRAYACVLSGYTVAIVALPNIDSPLQTFEAAANRGAAIVLGIAALAVISDVFSPDSLPSLQTKLDAVRNEVRRFVFAALSGETPDLTGTAKLYADIAALRVGALALPAESIAGRIRSAAARRALGGLAGEARCARELATASADLRAQVFAALKDGNQGAEAELHQRQAEGTPLQLFAASHLLENASTVEEASRALRTGRGSTKGPTLPIDRPLQAAARNAFRVGTGFALASAFFVVSGWPATSYALVHIAIFMCLSTVNPDPLGYVVQTVAGTGIVIAAVGVTEFLVLDGADAFPQLAIAMFLTVVPASLMKASSHAAIAAIGQRISIFFFVLLSPDLIESYSAQSYLSQSTILAISALLFLAVRTTILPFAPDRRQDWLIDAARRALVVPPLKQRRCSVDANFWCVDLIAQASRVITVGGMNRDVILQEVFRLTDAEMLGQSIMDNCNIVKKSSSD